MGSSSGFAFSKRRKRFQRFATFPTAYYRMLHPITPPMVSALARYIPPNHEEGLYRFILCYRPFPEKIGISTGLVYLFFIQKLPKTFFLDSDLPSSPKSQYFFQNNLLLDLLYHKNCSFSMELFTQFVQILLFFPCFGEIGILQKKVWAIRRSCDFSA